MHYDELCTDVPATYHDVGKLTGFEYIYLRLIRITHADSCAKSPLSFLFCMFVWITVFYGATGVPLFCTLDNSAHEFQSRDGFIVTCASLLFVQNDSHDHLCGSQDRASNQESLSCEARTIPRC